MKESCGSRDDSAVYRRFWASSRDSTHNENCGQQTAMVREIAANKNVIERGVVNNINEIFSSIAEPCCYHYHPSSHHVSSTMLTTGFHGLSSSECNPLVSSRFGTKVANVSNVPYSHTTIKPFCCISFVRAHTTL